MMNVTTEATSTPRIYVACLAAYNTGMAYGKWFDVGNDADELEIAILEMLTKSPSPAAEEWAIHDSENLGPVAEYEDLYSIVMKAGFIEDHKELGEAILDHCSGNLEDAIDMIDRYCGKYDSELDFAYYDTENNHDLTKMSFLAYYLDYEAIARDLFINEYNGIRLNGMTHVFSN